MVYGSDTVTLAGADLPFARQRLSLGCRRDQHDPAGPVAVVPARHAAHGEPGKPAGRAEGRMTDVRLGAGSVSARAGAGWRRSPTSRCRCRAACSSRCWGRAAAARPRCCASIAGTLAPDGGRVMVDGTDVTRVPTLPAQHGHGIPELRAVPASVGRRQRRVPARRCAACREPSSASAWPRRCAMVHLGCARGALSARAFRRPAAARRAGAGDRLPADHPAAGRAAVESRRLAARGDAAGDQPGHAAAWHHRDLRHA